MKVNKEALLAMLAKERANFKIRMIQAYKDRAKDQLEHALNAINRQQKYLEQAHDEYKKVQAEIAKQEKKEPEINYERFNRAEMLIHALTSNKDGSVTLTSRNMEKLLYAGVVEVIR